MLTHIKDAKSHWTVVIDNRSYQFDPSHPEYIALVECVKTGDVDEFTTLLNTGTVIENWSEGAFRFEDGVLYYVEEVVHNVITNRIIEMIKQGFDYKPILRFLERLYQNPSYRAINELYTFLTHKFLPITEDGYFLAYKAVTSDFRDKYTCQIDNSVGQSPSMPRFRVDDNCGMGCSKGLHVGAIDYVQSYGCAGDKVVVCKVDPADVVSVPLDSQHQKVRCCKYEVVAEYNGELLPPVVEEYEYSHLKKLLLDGDEEDLLDYLEDEDEDPRDMGWVGDDGSP